MDQSNIYDKLTLIFQEIFSNSSLVLSESLSANDVDNWDSLTHMILITEIETKFNIKFKLKELNKMKNVGDLVGIISTKLSE
jgi:acyl carrier protein